MSGEETSTAAANAARKAAETDSTGLIYASSNTPAQKTESSVEEQPATVVILRVAPDSLEIDGAAVAEDSLGQLLSARLEQAPDLLVVMQQLSGVGPERLAAVAAIARDAGVKHVQEQPDLGDE